MRFTLNPRTLEDTLQLVELTLEDTLQATPHILECRVNPRMTLLNQVQYNACTKYQVRYSAHYRVVWSHIGQHQYLCFKLSAIDIVYIYMYTCTILSCKIQEDKTHCS